MSLRLRWAKNMYARSRYNRGTLCFWHLKNTGLKVYKFISIQNQEEHIGHVKQSKVTDFRIV